MNSQNEGVTDLSEGSFRISSEPVFPPETKESERRQREIGDSDPESLPRSYGDSILFAIARDPASLFVYWDINWSSAFAGVTGQDRKAYLRIFDSNGSEIKRIEIEPLSNSCDLSVGQPRSSYRIEIGYFDRERTWHAVGASDTVTTPADKIGTLAPGDFALVPFHITFQRLTQLFRAAKNPDEPLTQSLARLQEKASCPDEGNALTWEEREVFRAMKVSLDSFPKRDFDRASEMRLQQKLERILGFGGGSQTSPFGGSSRSV